MPSLADNLREAVHPSARRDIRHEENAFWSRNPVIIIGGRSVYPERICLLTNCATQ